MTIAPAFWHAMQEYSSGPGDYFWDRGGFPNEQGCYHWGTLYQQWGSPWEWLVKFNS